MREKFRLCVKNVRQPQRKSKRTPHRIAFSAAHTHRLCARFVYMVHAHDLPARLVYMARAHDLPARLVYMARAHGLPARLVYMARARRS